MDNGLPVALVLCRARSCSKPRAVKRCRRHQRAGGRRQNGRAAARRTPGRLRPRGADPCPQPAGRGKAQKTKVASRRLSNQASSGRHAAEKILQTIARDADRTARMEPARPASASPAPERRCGRTTVSNGWRGRRWVSSARRSRDRATRPGSPPRPHRRHAGVGLGCRRFPAGDARTAGSWRWRSPRSHERSSRPGRRSGSTAVGRNGQLTGPAKGWR